MRAPGLAGATPVRGLVRAGLVPLALTALVLTGAGPVPPAGAADTGTVRPAAAERMVRQIQATRAEHGLSPLRVSADLTAVATGWAGQLAAHRDVAHNPRLGTDVGGWQVLGENVGKGPDAASLYRAFLSSPRHRANILDRGFTDVGAGAARGPDGALYVVVDFRRPTHPPVAPATPPLSQPAAQPAPAAGDPVARPKRPATERAEPRAVAHPTPPRPTPAGPDARALARTRRLSAVLATRPRSGDPVAMAVGFAQAMAALGGGTVLPSAGPPDGGGAAPMRPVASAVRFGQLIAR